MILAAINWLSISINLLIVVLVVVCLLMALLILMQRPKQEGLGAAFGGGVTDQVFGAQTTNVLQRGTVYLGSMFFIISLTLAILIGKETKTKTLIEIDKPVAKQETTQKQDKAKSLSEELPVTVETQKSPSPEGPSSNEELPVTPATQDISPIPAAK